MGIDDLIRAIKALPTPQHRPEAGADSGPTAELLGALRQAAGGAPDVPRGWTRLHHDAVRMLQSATLTVESRQNLRVTAIYILGSQPYVRLSSDDPIVHGIYRRTLARARHTCQVCGRVGRTWDCISQFQVLCARCAAPHVVAADLDTLQALREEQRRANHDAPLAELPARLAATIATALSLSDSLDRHQDAPAMSPARPVSREELERWCAWLLALRDDPRFAEALDSAQ